PDNDVNEAVLVHIARRHEDAARQGRREDEEVADQLEGHAVVDLDLGQAAWTSADYYVWHAITGHVADSNGHTAGEDRRPGIEAGLQRPGLGVVDVDLWRGAGAGADGEDRGTGWRWRRQRTNGQAGRRASAGPRVVLEGE